MNIVHHFAITGVVNGKEYNIPIPTTLSESVVSGFADMVKYAPNNISNVVCIKLTRELFHCSLSQAVDFVRDLRWDKPMFHDPRYNGEE
jgi:hypothetical protein